MVIFLHRSDAEVPSNISRIYNVGNFPETNCEKITLKIIFNGTADTAQQLSTYNRIEIFSCLLI